MNFLGVCFFKFNFFGGENVVGGGLMMLFGEFVWEWFMIVIGFVVGVKFCYE